MFFRTLNKFFKFVKPKTLKIHIKMEDATMETCPSPEIGDSRKRPLDTDPENEQTKRSHFSSGKFFLFKKKSKSNSISFQTL